jgi:O-antigen ligase
LLFLGWRQTLRLQSVVPLGIFLATLFSLFLGLALFIRYRRKKVLFRASLVLGLFALLLAGAWGLSRAAQKESSKAERGTEFHSWQPAAYLRLWEIHRTTEIPQDPRQFKTSRRPPYVPVADNEEFYKLEAVFAAEPSQAVRNNMWRFLVWRQMACDWRERRLLTGAGVGHSWFCRGMYESAFNYGEERLGLDPHNSYLHFLYRFGLAGFALFLLTVIAVIRAAWRKLSMLADGDSLLEGLLLYWAYTAAFALVTVALEGPSYASPFWLTLGLIAAYAPTAGQAKSSQGDLAESKR